MIFDNVDDKSIAKVSCNDMSGDDDYDANDDIFGDLAGNEEDDYNFFFFDDDDDDDDDHVDNDFIRGEYFVFQMVLKLLT